MSEREYWQEYEDTERTEEKRKGKERMKWEREIEYWQEYEDTERTEERRKGKERMKWETERETEAAVYQMQ